MFDKRTQKKRDQPSIFYNLCHEHDSVANSHASSMVPPNLRRMPPVDKWLGADATPLIKSWKRNAQDQLARNAQDQPQKIKKSRESK
jgi:hypothetical protein